MRARVLCGARRRHQNPWRAPAAVLDCRGVDALRLRFQNRERDDLVLTPGVHAIGHAADGRPCLVDHPDDALVQFCIDRRGTWLQLRDSAPGLHVNGRPVRRMAMLRAGDSVHIDGIELTLLGADPRPMPRSVPDVGAMDSRVVLRGVGGLHHGRCYSLDQSREIGRLPECAIRVDEPTFAERHARLEPHQDGVVLRDLGSANGTVVNGHPVRDALLRPGDQIAFGAQHRFVLESPLSGTPVAAAKLPMDEEIEFRPPRQPEPSPIGSSMRRMPWLLLAALLLAGALTLLLLYGVR